MEYITDFISDPKTSLAFLILSIILTFATPLFTVFSIIPLVGPIITSILTTGITLTIIYGITGILIIFTIAQYIRENI